MKLSTYYALTLCLTPISAHALEAINTEDLASYTGQAGITIDLETEVNIGQVQWNDTDSQGVVNLNGVRLGGWNPGESLNNIRAVVDSTDNGDLVINITNQSQTAADGSFLQPPWFSNADDTDMIELGLDITALEISNGTTASTIMSNINLDVLLGPQRFTITNDGNVGTINAMGLFEIAGNSGFDLDVAGVSVTNFKVGNFTGAIVADDDVFIIDGPSGIATRTDAGELYNNPQDYGMAYYNVTIAANAEDQLTLDVNNFNVDMQMDIAVGGANIGQVTFTDFDVSGTNLTIYGH